MDMNNTQGDWLKFRYCLQGVDAGSVGVEMEKVQRIQLDVACGGAKVHLTSAQQEMVQCGAVVLSGALVLARQAGRKPLEREMFYPIGTWNLRPLSLPATGCRCASVRVNAISE